MSWCGAAFGLAVGSDFELPGFHRQETPSIAERRIDLSLSPVERDLACVGLPECALNLAQASVYLALAPQ